MMRLAIVALLALAGQAWGISGLHAMVKEDDAAAIERAVAEGVDINDKTTGSGGQTPLMFGCLTGKVKAVEVLLRLGADTTIGEKDGYTPPHGAGFQGRAEVMRALHAHGVDVNQRHSDGYLPLHRAAWGQSQGHADVIKFLVKEAGVRPAAKASNGNTIFTHAAPGPVGEYIAKLKAELGGVKDDEADL
eukprot:TRINITY_DN25732_c0_g1_i1.p2 TRINITY_DN25732_c0_g1~~TRINITY_DN25732_c0_g1_i1.p2  ORF type:complete len:190 (+),score=53.56 TRINITY_DN25732_c0_g1_i1:79-648(+)